VRSGTDSAARSRRKPAGGRAAAELVGVYAAADAHRGRNEPGRAVEGPAAAEHRVHFVEKGHRRAVKSTRSLCSAAAFQSNQVTSLSWQ
jgi:hypothetical protein